MTSVDETYDEKTWAQAKMMDRLLRPLVDKYRMIMICQNPMTASQQMDALVLNSHELDHPTLCKIDPATGEVLQSTQLNGHKQALVFFIQHPQAQVVVNTSQVVCLIRRKTANAEQSQLMGPLTFQLLTDEAQTQQYKLYTYSLVLAHHEGDS